VQVPAGVRRATQVAAASRLCVLAAPGCAERGGATPLARGLPLWRLVGGDQEIGAIVSG